MFITIIFLALIPALRSNSGMKRERVFEIMVSNDLLEARLVQLYNLEKKVFPSVKRIENKRKLARYTRILRWVMLIYFIV